MPEPFWPRMATHSPRAISKPDSPQGLDALAAAAQAGAPVAAEELLAQVFDFDCGHLLLLNRGTRKGRACLRRRRAENRCQPRRNIAPITIAGARDAVKWCAFTSWVTTSRSGTPPTMRNTRPSSRAVVSPQRGEVYRGRPAPDPAAECRRSSDRRDEERRRNPGARRDRWSHPGRARSLSGPTRSAARQTRGEPERADDGPSSTVPRRVGGATPGWKEPGRRSRSRPRAVGSAAKGSPATR